MKTVIRNSYTPQIGDYCETIVVDRESGFKYLFDCDGVYTRSSIGEIIEDLDGYREAHKDTDVFSTGGTLDAIDYYVGEEAAAREAADGEIEQEIEDLRNNTDVVDIVGTYAELQAYDTSKLGDNDIIKVLQDETRDDATTYYKWHKTTSTWEYIGEQGPFYTKGQTDLLLADKQDKLIAGSNITIAADGKTISATGGLSPEIVADLPVTGDDKTLYLVPLTDPGDKFHRSHGNPISIPDGAGGTEIDVDFDGIGLSQSGTPTPSSQSPISLVESAQVVTITDGTNTKTYTVNLASKNMHNVSTDQGGKLLSDGRTDTSSGYSHTIHIKVKPNTTYSITSGKGLYSAEYTLPYSVAENFVSGTYVYRNTAASCTFTTSATTQYLIFSGSEANMPDIQFQEDPTSAGVSAHTDWHETYYLAKYGEKENFLFKNVPESPHYDPTLIEGGIYFHKEVQVVRSTDFVNSNSNYSVWNSTNHVFSWSFGGFGIDHIPDATTDYTAVPKIMCDYYEAKSKDSLEGAGATEDYGVYWYQYSTSPVVQWRLHVKNIDLSMTGSAMAQWIGAHPMVVCYPLANAEIIHVTDHDIISQLEALDNATIYSGANTITNTVATGVAADMDIEYYGTDPQQMYEEYIWVGNEYERLGPPTLAAGDNIVIEHNIISAHIPPEELDTELSFDSENGVQNKAIKSAIFMEGTGYTYGGYDMGVDIEPSNPVSNGIWVRIGTGTGTPNGGSSSDSIAIGNAVTMHNTRSVALGGSASSAGRDSTALGWKATAQQYSVAVGTGAGQSTAAAATYAISVGSSSKANAQYGIAIGASSTIGTAAQNAIAIGRSASGGSSSYGYNSIAIGQSATSVGNYSIVIGDTAKTLYGTSEYAVAIGRGAQVSGVNAVAIGQGSLANEVDTVSVGNATSSPVKYRRLVNVADAVNAHDAITKGQFDATVCNIETLLAAI